MRYPPLDKLALALMISAQKLQTYFLGHPVVVMTNQPLRHKMRKADAFGRLVKWLVELREFNIKWQMVD